ncbi:uncharacterized protein LOC131214637, partial [Anopheles bellator]|uniref:uncharacterized protein LOC131214637 n=1 Tax=Anopheles bellator TaxID=139047 RepID=UPI002648060E
LVLALFLVGSGQVQAQATLCATAPQYSFVPHETDCWRYYTCVGGQGFLQECPIPFIFVAATQMCDFGDRNACVVCPATGVQNFPVEGSCTRFVQCIEGTEFQRECPAGTQFDKTVSQCNLASVVGCTELDCPAVDDPLNPVITPDPNNCRVYFICVQGQGIQQTCPIGTRFNPALSVCDLEANVPCPSTPGTPNITSGSHGHYCVNNHGMALRPIPNDCNSYVMCLNSEPHIMTCPLGKSFDREANVCMDTDIAKCRLDTKSLCGDGSTSSMNTVPYPNSCTKYLLCIHNEAFEMECPSHERYDTLTNRCVNANDALCSLSTPLLLADAKPFANPCAGNAGVNYVPDPTNCQRYYMCIQTDGFENTCPNNQIFDIVSKGCGPVGQSTCVVDQSSDAVDNSGNPCSGNSGIAYKPHPEDCSRYYMCMDAQAIERVCGSGEVFDINRSMCGTRQTSTCILDAWNPSPPAVESNPCGNNVGIGYLPHQGDCTRYYMCMDTQAIERTCSAGQVFDIYNLICSARETSTCILDQPEIIVPTAPPSLDAFTACFDNIGTNNRPHPTDCTLYYLCINSEG